VAHRYFSAEETLRLIPKLLGVNLDETTVAFLRGAPQDFIRMDGLMTPERHNFTAIASYWLEDLLTSRGAATRLASMSNVSELVGDPRVREYTREERVLNASWIKLGGEIASYKMIAEVGYTHPLFIVSSVTLVSVSQSLAKAEHCVVPMGIEASEPGKLMGGAVNSLTSKIDTLRTERARSLPSWWKTWRETLENSQKTRPRS
jgi:hypothetical protein